MPLALKKLARPRIPFTAVTGHHGSGMNQGADDIVQRCSHGGASKCFVRGLGLQLGSNPSPEEVAHRSVKEPRSAIIGGRLFRRTLRYTAFCRLACACTDKDAYCSVSRVHRFLNVLARARVH